MNKEIYEEYQRNRKVMLYFYEREINKDECNYAQANAFQNAALLFDEKIEGFGKCELCKRELGRYVEEIEEIVFDGNRFRACEACRQYLESEIPEVKRLVFSGKD